MRIIISIILGFVILVAVSLFAIYHINQSVDVIQADLDQTEKLILASNWNEALEKLKTTQEYWYQTKNWWSVLLDHNALNSIEISIKRLEKFIETKQTPLSLAELETLKILIKEIPDSEVPKIYNIL